MWGNDKFGKPYVHVRIFKQGRIFGDVIMYSGPVKICCRECLRWHRINFVGEKNDRAELVETTRPEEVDNGSALSQTERNEG